MILTFEHSFCAIFEVQFHENSAIISIVRLSLIDAPASALAGRLEFCRAENFFDLGFHGLLERNMVV